MVPEPLADLETERERLRAALAGREAATLAVRPQHGTWSVVENLRHLLFAEQAHLGGFAAVRPNFSPLGLPPPGMVGSKRVGLAGTQASDSASEVLAAWDAAHADLRQTLTADGERFDKALARHLKHLRLHIGIIERQLRAADRSRG